MTQFSFNRDGNGHETLVLFPSDGTPRILTDSHANYGAIKSALLDPHVVEVDETQLLALADAATTALTKLRRLSEHVLIKGDTILFRGEEMENRLTKHLVKMIQGGDENYGGYVQFLERVQANPSKASRKSLFKFLDKHDLLITPSGHFIAYKGVDSEGRSISVGNEDVTVTLADGTVEVHRGKIPDPVDATVEMARSLVDANRDVLCSVGLHVGAFDYATGWAQGRFLTVEVDPADVVSVPSDSNDQKIRTSRFHVIEENPTFTRYEGTSFDVKDIEYDDGYSEVEYDFDEYDDSFDGPVL